MSLLRLEVQAKTYFRINSKIGSIWQRKNRNTECSMQYGLINMNVSGIKTK